MELSADVELRGDTIVVSCRGRIIYGDEPLRIARRVTRLNAPTRHVVVDLSGVELRPGDLPPLIAHHFSALAEGYRISFTCVPPQITALLETTGTTALFEIPTLQRAAGF